MKYITAMLLCLLPMLAFALPSPNEVDAAYNSGNYSKAESMLIEVMKEHPSAKAHFRLGEVYMRENRHKESLNEFRQAQVLDPSLKFVKSAEIFNRLITNEQAIVTGAGSIIAPTMETQLAVVQAKSQIQQQQTDHTLFVVFSLLVLIAMFSALMVFLKSRTDKKRIEKETDDNAKMKHTAARDQLNTFLDLNNQLNDADLIRKTATYNDETKQQIGDRIKTLSTTLVDLMSDAKKDITVSDSRLATISRNVSEIVKVAETGIYTPSMQTAKAKPDDSYEYPKYGGNFAPPFPMPPAPNPYSTSTYSPTTQQAQPQTVVVQNSNNDLLTGMLIGEALNNHHARYNDDDVIMHRTIIEDEPTYVAPARSSRRVDDDDRSTSSSSSSSWSDNSSTDSSSSSSWNDSSSSDSSSSSSSSSDW